MKRVAIIASAIASAKTPLGREPACRLEAPFVEAHPVARLRTPTEVGSFLSTLASLSPDAGSADQAARSATRSST
jgi:hypothetical protein